MSKFFSKLLGAEEDTSDSELQFSQFLSRVGCVPETPTDEDIFGTELPQSVREEEVESQQYHLFVVESGCVPRVEDFWTREELDARLQSLGEERSEIRVIPFKGEQGYIFRQGNSFFSAFIEDCSIAGPDDDEMIEGGYLGVLEHLPDDVEKPSVESSPTRTWGEPTPMEPLEGTDSQSPDDSDDWN